jgi:hypothetical protein
MTLTGKCEQSFDWIVCNVLLPMFRERKAVIRSSISVCELNFAMNFRLLVCLLLICGSPVLRAMAQGNGKCPPIYVDIKKGTINKIKPNATPEKMQEVFPCFTGITGEDEGYNCGGGVFFINNDFYCYTGRDYFEIRAKFKGEWSHKLLGLRAADLEFKYGSPVREEEIPGYKVHFFKMKYGCLRVQFSTTSKRAEEIGIHYVPASRVELCY